MAGDKRWKSPDMKVRARLSKAQEELWKVQTERTQTMARGELEVEQARWRAARQLAKATKKVERKAAKVAKLEAQLPPLPVVRPAADKDDPPSRPTPMTDNARHSFSEDAILLQREAVQVDQPSSTNGDDPT